MARWTARWRAVTVLAGSTVAALLVVGAVVVSQAQHGEGWAALLAKRLGGNTGWSRLPGHGIPTLWHEEPKASKSASSSDGWGRLPEQHKPRIKHKIQAKPKHHTTLDHQLPAVYHLPSQPGVHAVVPKADRLAAEKLARNLHQFHKEAMALPRGRMGQQVARRVSAAQLRKEEKALPPGFHILKPGQKLPKGARIVRSPPLAAGYHVLKPGMTLPKGAKMVMHPPQLATERTATSRRRNLRRMNVPHVGASNHMLDAEEEGGEEEGGDCECEEGDEECECAEEVPRVANVTVVEPTADERMQIAFENHRASRIERIKARELKKQAATTERDGVRLIQSGWERHKQAETSIEAAKAKMEEADAMVANANKVLDLANAHKSEALATQMETIAEEFKTAAEEKAAKAEEYKAEAETIKAEQEAAEAEEAGGEEEGR